MKLPFAIKMPNLGGVFSRLNPAGLIAKIKAKKGDGEDEDEFEGGGEGDDLFGDLGDLDQLDAEAVEAAEGEGDDPDLDDDFADFDNKPLDDEPLEDDEFDDADDHDFDDFEDDEEGAPPPPSSSDAPADDLASEVMEDLGDFDIGAAFDDHDDEDDDEDDEEAQKAKLKKLAMLAGGGVAAAVVLGGFAWWLMGGDEVPAPEDQIASSAVEGKPGDMVISLDDVPPFGDETPIAPSQPAPTTNTMDNADAGQADGGLAPPVASAAPESATPQPPVEEATGEVAELRKLGLDVQMEPGIGVVIPSVTKASYAELPAWPAAEPLQVSPLLTLVEQGEHGMLPKIGKDGDTPFDAYGRPEPAEKSGDPKIAIIVTGLGLSRAATEAAIASMPADVTLSLDVYARGLDFWVKRARNAGHEVLLNMPGESSDFPFSDPGPNALKSLVPPAENIKQLEWILSRTTGYFGVLSVYGSKFLTVEEQVQAVLDVIKRRGLMYVDGGAEDSLGTRVAYKVGAKWATVELTLDSNPGKKALQLQLQELETLAKKRAVAIARVSADPGSLEVLSAWLSTIQDKGLQLVPVSSLANKQLIR